MLCCWVLLSVAEMWPLVLQHHRCSNVFPRCVFVQSSAAVFMYRLSGLKTLLSSGWRRCEQWDGKESRTMLLDRKKSIASTERCDQWLFRRSEHLQLQGHTSMSDKVLEEGQKVYVLHPPWAICITSRADVTSPHKEVTAPTCRFTLAKILPGSRTVVVPEN